jgi:hypothetical protein
MIGCFSAIKLIVSHFRQFPTLSSHKSNVNYTHRTTFRIIFSVSIAPGEFLQTAIATIAETHQWAIYRAFH